MATAVVFYSASAAAGAALGGPAVQAQLLDPAAWTGGAGAALLFLAPLLAFLGVSIFLADLAPGLQRLKKEFIEKIVPMLEDVPLWGLVVLAFGAGLGEEVLFRGAVQPFAVRLAAALLIPAAGYTGAAAAVPAVGVAATSVIFGLLHALTPTYFLWATAAGALFGIEALVSGLPAAVITHAVYDLLALALVLQQWGRPVWLRGGATGKA